MCDHLQAETPHEYQLRWHFSPEAGAALRVTSNPEPRVEALGVTLAFAPGRDIRLEDGWYAPSYGVKTPAPVATVAAHGQRATFLTVIDPSPSAHAPLSTRLLSDRCRPDAPTMVAIAGTGEDGRHTDTVIWSSHVQDLALGGFRGAARAVWCRTTANGRVVAVTALDADTGRAE